MALEWARLLRQQQGRRSGSLRLDKCEDVVRDHGCDANQVDGVEASDGG